MQLYVRRGLTQTSAITAALHRGQKHKFNWLIESGTGSFPLPIARASDQAKALFVKLKQATPRFLGLLLVVDTSIRRAPAMGCVCVHFDLGRQICFRERSFEDVLIVR